MDSARSLARFDVVVTILAGWMTFGVFLDGWGHHHGATETFFTPWHFALYSGYAVLAGALFGYPLRRRRQGIRPATPAGYKAAVWGAAVFAFGGFADGVWHSVFGIEHKVEAFVSPPHITLFASGAVMVLGPLAALRHRPPQTRWRKLLPAVLALAYSVGLIQFATENDNALLLPAASGEHLPYAGPLGPKGFLPFEIGVAYGLAAVVVQSALVAGIVIVLSGRMRPPFGALTLILEIGIGHSLIIHNAFWILIPVGIAGLFGDLLIATSLRERVGAWVAPTLVPAVLTAGWVVFLGISYGYQWSTHLVTGAVCTAGAAGVMVAMVAGSRAVTAATPKPVTAAAPASPERELVTTS
jgi:hypothetical protein